MKTIRVIGLAALLVALALPAFPQDGDDDDDGSCFYNGRSYASSVAVCQGGQVQLCVGGEWHTRGEFCDGAPDGRALGVPVLGPGQVIIKPALPQKAIDDD